MKKQIKIIIALAVLVVAISMFSGLKYVLAEQSGSSPESGATSRILSLYNDLSALTFGSDTATPDWGTLWNRIKTAAKWTPSGTAVEADVATGKTFYNTTRGAKTGAGTIANLTPAGPCSTQQYYDAYGAPVTESNNCSLTWTANPGGSVTGDDAKAGRGGYDPRTGLTWSNYLKNNAGAIQFVTSGGSTWNWDGSGKITFTVTAANATAGATYTNNSKTFTVVTTIAGTTSLATTPTGSPAASGTLTLVTGTGDATITFSTFSASTTNASVGDLTAKQLCNSSSNPAGAGVWRLPTEKELMQAYIDGAYWNLTNTSSSYSFWSATETSSTYAYYVNLNDGYTYNFNKTSSYYVRCVR
jgi:hypothetical protein